MHKIFFTFSFLSLFLFSCSKKQSNDEVNGLNIDVKEDFTLFYKKFYADSNFQKQRIIYPFKITSSSGSEDDPDYLKEFVFKTSNDWENLKTLAKDTIIKDENSTEEWKKEILPIKKNIVTEKIYIVDSGFIELREFKLIDKKWMLVSNDISNF